MKEWKKASKQEIENMSFDEAKEIVEKQITLGKSSGDFRPREHLTKALEIILQKASDNTRI